MTEPRRRVAPRFEGLHPSSCNAAKAKRANAGKDTQAELLLRHHVWRLGLRYRLHRRDLPGRPDLVFPGATVAVFVDGDFWHGRDWEVRETRLAAGSNAAYWTEKIAYNRERDARNDSTLVGLGWQVLHLWETDIKADPAAAAQRVLEAVRRRR